ncbi:MAG: hypothetical protein CVV49_00630 [Spirochaetae bacterium HGW-Spirochaetae-5]|nr:MAG: hypothetical protein CVV49_00630 [Spirochaetae bacterium HGW-Spirochaetae-5]
MEISIKQSLAIAIQAKFDVPEFLILDSFPEDKCREIQASPDYEIIENVAIPVSDMDIEQILYFKDGKFHYPSLFINDRYLLSGRQGGILPANLVTAFPGQIVKSRQLQALQGIISEYSGFITISQSIIDNKMYFKDLKFGILPDYIPHLEALHGEESPDWFSHNLEDLKLKAAKGMTASCRLYSYPYDEDNLKVVEQFPEIDAILIESCYMTLKYSPKAHIKDLWKELYKPLQDPYYAHNGLVFNPEGGIKARKVYSIIRKSRIL